MAKTKPLTDSEILSLLKGSISRGVKYSDTKLATERRKTLNYYEGKLPAPAHKGNSTYVSTDVYDTVEAMKSTLVETFSATSDIISFKAKGPEDVEMAKVATAYVKHVVYEQNDGINLFGSVIHDGLLSRVGVCKVYWDDTKEAIDETFEGLDDAQLGILLEDEEVELTELVVDEETGELSGSLTRVIDRSQVRLTVLPPEEFIVQPDIKSLDDAPFISHRTQKSKSDLLKAGFKKELVEELEPGNDELETDSERENRFLSVADSFGDEDREQEATRLLTVYETYGEIEMDGSGVASMWKIVHCGQTVLDKEMVERHPFRVFCPLTMPHSFFGGNFAARVIPTQNAKTVLTRSILDHAVIANNPRYGVVKGALTNPRELLDNRIGGVVNVTRQDGIFPIQQAPLNPFVYQTINMLDENKEDVTGVSRLSQGLNKDALSSQNAQGMVEQLINASMQRQKTIARVFATQFLAHLFLDVYRIVISNVSAERIVEIAGAYVPVTPSSWRRQRDVTVDMHLGYGERDRIAAEYLEIGQLIASDEAVKHLFGPEKHYNIFKAALEAKGHKDISLFLDDPTKVEPPQPDPMMQLQMQQLQTSIEIDKRKQDLAEKKTTSQISLDELKADMDRRFKTLEFALSTQEAERKSAETENRIEVAQAEMQLAAEAQAKAPEENNKASAIISPNG